MRPKTIILSLLMAAAVPGISKDNKTHCTITGRIIDYPGCVVYVTPLGADSRATGIDTIPVADGRFRYDIRTDGPEVYTANAALGGNSYYVDFFVENGTVDITFYGYKAAEMRSSTPLNKELLKVENAERNFFVPLLDKLNNMEHRYTDEGLKLVQAIRTTTDRDSADTFYRQIKAMEKAGTLFTAEYMETKRQTEEAFTQAHNYLTEYASNNLSPVGLYYLNQLSKKYYGITPDTAGITRLFNESYAKRFSGSKLAELMRHKVASYNIKVGGRYHDFSAPDLNGKMHTLSEEIKGKVALIDLWASWCGPCRRLSKSMIPIYEKYKSRGFTVVGVAREQNARNMAGAIKRDKYPWLNLLELKDRAKIWQNYGVGDSGGSTFLVDRNGKILAIHPTAEEVESFLKDL